ncbi:OmpP1/FadL family transporter [Acinetobacter sp. YH18001]|uniref:OmpP1/FadL family transporter n=1 Tax=Acinetobacter sp. YH18001 TaxID=2601197 RepID=UPI0015D3ED21|nr:outer membrane protein transport protein [Acinetobacter sp. YH18001]
MKLTTLASTILLISLPSTGALAAAMDRSGQSISAFLQPGNYFDASISVLDADVSGQMRDGWNTPSTDTRKVGTDLANSKISDMAESFYFTNFALKIQANENISFGLIYDQPFGAKANYSSGDQKHTVVPPTSNFAQDILESGAFHRGDEGTNVEVTTQNLSFIMGYQPNENWNIYAGPVYQTVKGDLQLRGSVYGPLGGHMCSDKLSLLCSTFTDKDTGETYNGYNASIPEKSEFGWLGGIAFQIPEIALKASLTYRSEIDYEVDVEENTPLADNLLIGYIGVPALGPNFTYTEGKTKITTPQSINLDFQSGIMENTLAFINLRWVDWSKFSIRPHKFGQLSSALTEAVAGTPRGFDLIAYEKDQYSANFGVARKLNDKWAISLLGGWDSGAGNPTSTLGPTEGYWSAGLGGQYSPTEKSFLQVGARYFWLGDAKAQSASWFGTDRYDADFKSNNALGYSVKIGHRF